MKVKFKKRRYFQKKLYNVGDVVDMPKHIARAYLNARAVEQYAGEVKGIGIISPEEKKNVLGDDFTIEKTEDTSAIFKDDENENIEIEEADASEPNELKKETEKEVPPPIYYGDLKYAELQKLAKEKGLPAGGSKSDIIKRLERG